MTLATAAWPAIIPEAKGKIVMAKYRVTAKDRQSGRDLRLDLDAQSEVEAEQIVGRFASVRKVGPAPRESGKESSSPTWCPHCGNVLTVDGPIDRVGPKTAHRTGPQTVSGQVSAMETLSTTLPLPPGTKKSSAQQVVAGLIIAMGLPVLIFGMLLAKEPEPDASRGQTLLLSAGILIAVGLGWLVVALVSSREKR